MTAKKRKNPPRRAENKVTLTISLPKDLKAHIETLAEADKRSISNFLVIELERMLAKKGGQS